MHVLKECAFQLLLELPRYVPPWYTLAGTKLDTGIDPLSLLPLVDYWEECRGVYRPFESGQLTGSADVYDNEVRNHRTRGWSRWAAVPVTRPAPYISPLCFLSLVPNAALYAPQIPGGQYTNMLFQSKQLGLTGQWSAIKKAYAAANRVMGDVVKVSGGHTNFTHRLFPSLFVCGTWYLDSTSHSASLRYCYA